MKLTGFDCVTVSLPQSREHPTALGRGGSDRLGRYVILEVSTDEGIVGLGEATVLITWAGDHGRYYGEDPATTVHMIRDVLGPALVGHSPFDIEAAHQRMRAAVKGYPYAKSAIDMALHDIVGKALNVPVYRLLGGLVNERLPVAHSLGILDDEELVARATAAVDEGIRTIKLKVGLDGARDVRAVAAVREAVGSGIDLVIDANSGYGTPKEAIAVLNKMAEFDLRYAEQPVEGLEAMARVTAAVPMRVMADESAWSPRDVMEIARTTAADCVSLYTTKPGGLAPAKKVAAVAEAAGLLCNVNGSAETGIGTAANLHLAASTAVVTEPIVVPVTTIAGQEQTQTAGIFYSDDIVTSPFKYQDGMLEVPHGPGLGVVLDREKVERYRILEDRAT